MIGWDELEPVESVVQMIDPAWSRLDVLMRNTSPDPTHRHQRRMRFGGWEDSYVDHAHYTRVVRAKVRERWGRA